MNPELRKRLERLGPVHEIERVTCGSPALIDLSLARDLASLKTIDGTRSLAKRGLTMLQAKRAIETVLETGHVVVALPTVEVGSGLFDELAAAGFRSAHFETRADQG